MSSTLNSDTLVDSKADSSVVDSIVETPKKRNKTPVRLADRDTPLIKNCWYVLDWSHEVTRELKNRMVIGQDLVYFRNKSGTVTALQNRCAHRGFPLHRSTLNEDDTIQCGYHGLTYNTKGQCVRIPSAVGHDPGYISVQHYPIVEKAPLIWVWTGDEAKADISEIPEYDWVNTDEWGYGTGHVYVKSNYLAVHENLMDITHFQYLHGAALGTPKHAESEVQVTIDGNSVDNYRLNEGEGVPQLHLKATGLEADVPISRHAHSTFITPGFHEGYGTFIDPAGTNNGRKEYHPRILHFMTPESQYTTWYWWIFARDFTPDDKEIDQFYSDTTLKVFLEDKDAVEWIEEGWAKEDRPGYREKHVVSDRGAMAMRRIVQKLADDEQKQSAEK